MSFIGRVGATFRFANEVRNLVRNPISVEEARRMLASQLAARERNLLVCLERAVYAEPRSPYRRLLEHAGIELSDVAKLIEQTGLEATLSYLHDAGVYVTQDEFKGRAPIKRPGLEFLARARDFDNPLQGQAALERRSSGAGDSAINVGVYFDDTAYRAGQALLTRHLGLEDRPIGIWQEAAVRGMLRYGRMGFVAKKAFTTIGFRWSWEGIHEAILINTTLFAARLSGYPMPRPKVVTKEDVLIVVKWLAQMTARGTPAIMSCHPSPAVRICLAAEEHGLDISGTVFHAGAEPYTPAKGRIFAAAGAIVLPTYSMSESGVVGLGCRTPAALDDLHLAKDKLAMITRQQTTPAGEKVDGLIYTSLLPSSPKVLLNAYSGDYATIAERECGCILGEMGFTTHLSEVRSYEKLTGEGVTFVGAKLYNLVEEVLPARFGGYVNDYQLAEEEQANGLPQLSVIVSPSVGPVNEDAVIETVLEELQTSHANGGGGSIMAAVWRQGNNVRVERREPEMSRNAKILPLRTRPKPAVGSGVVVETTH